MDHQQATMSSADAAQLNSPVLPPVLKTTMIGVKNAVMNLHTGRVGDLSLGVLTAHVSRLRHLVERDPGLEIAAADLLEAATALAAGDPGSESRLRRLLVQAHLRMHQRLASARLRDPVDGAQGCSESLDDNDLEYAGTRVSDVLGLGWSYQTRTFDWTVMMKVSDPLQKGGGAVRFEPEGRSATLRKAFARPELYASDEAEDQRETEVIDRLARALAPVQRPAQTQPRLRWRARITDWRALGASHR